MGYTRKSSCNVAHLHAVRPIVQSPHIAFDILAGGFPMNMGSTKHRAGCHGYIHLRNLVIRDGGNFRGLRIGQSRLGIKDLGAGAKALVELPHLNV